MNNSAVIDAQGSALSFGSEPEAQAAMAAACADSRKRADCGSWLTVSINYEKLTVTACCPNGHTAA